MKIRLKIVLLISLFFFIKTTSISAQISDTTVIWQITTLDDNEFVGHIMSETAQRIEFKTAVIGIIFIQKNQIARQEKLISSKSTNGLLWNENKLANRYFLGNSAYNLKKGEVYYQNAWLFINNFNIGITDQFSLGIGIAPLFLFNKGIGGTTPIWITPKFSLPLKAEKINIGVSGLFGTTFGNDFDNVGFGYGFGNITFGDKSKNLTLGLGSGFVGGSLADRPTISISGMLRTGKRGYIISESYVVTSGSNTNSVISLGGRFLGKHITLDYGGFYVPNTGNFTLLPWLSISVPLWKAKG